MLSPLFRAMSMAWPCSGNIYNGSAAQRSSNIANSVFAVRQYVVSAITFYLKIFPAIPLELSYPASYIEYPITVLKFVDPL